MRYIAVGQREGKQGGGSRIEGDVIGNEGGNLWKEAGEGAVAVRHTAVLVCPVYNARLHYEASRPTLLVSSALLGVRKQAFPRILVHWTQSGLYNEPTSSWGEWRVKISDEIPTGADAEFCFLCFVQ